MSCRMRERWRCWALRSEGFSGASSEALAPWRKPMSSHDPGKIVLDLAVALAVGGDCLADIGVLRAEPAVFGAVASDPTVSRLISALAADAPKAVAALAEARAAARKWRGRSPGIAPRITASTPSTHW